ncbi:hypothetical protein CDL12_05351 [Handroanthus impetiginosus]|uniref:Uncharacterized protein n=1 Tax=Handroanthus impetiginosus TaxID=429701 RepID=A0A2G9HWR2_9LAMI|nr:hypothetical protein CDL12_05351 [Handroanthus impetiginosus]
MKTSFSSTITYHHKIIILIHFTILFLLIIFSSTQPSVALHVGRCRHSCLSVSDQPRRLIGFQLQRILHSPPPLLPRPLALGEIDPRYGVEKRLVPSGPNPLHH